MKDDQVSDDEEKEKQAKKNRAKVAKKIEYQKAETEYIEDKMEVQDRTIDAVYQEEVEKRQKKRDQKAVFKKDKHDQTMKDVKEMDKSIQRMANYRIRKAKGIQRKKKKEDRNPRIKLKNKYNRALKKRRAMGVQEFNYGPQGKNHGEASGIRSTFNRGTKF